MKKITFLILTLFGLPSIFADEIAYTPPPKLPAYKTPSEKMKRGIRLYDFRSSNIELYRITEKPSISVRAVAEFEPSSALLLTYFPGNYDNFYKGIITSVINSVKIYFFYNSTSMKNAIISRLRSWGISDTTINSNTVFVNTEVDSVWMRDSGPNPIVSSDGKYGIVDFRYYPDRYYDDKIPTELGNILSLNVFRPSMDYEGGNFMTNGYGLCMATRGSIWENLPLKDNEIENILKDYMGCEKVVFLKPLSGEGTTHIDMFAKFTSEDTILLGQYEFSQDCINYDILEENYNLLLKTTTVDGKPLKIIRIPMPDNSDGVWRTYTNSLFINNIALVPVYPQHRTYEAAALNAYKTALGNNWTIIPIDSEEIIPDGGAIHCITMTIPDFELAKFQNDPDPLCGNSTDCNPPGCGSITSEGECDSDVLIWCENNEAYFYDCSSPCNMVPNGYPCELKCEYNNSKGYFDCISEYVCKECIDECQMGEKGCINNNTVWECAGDIDNDGCNEIKSLPCENNTFCKDGICQNSCTPDCAGKECGDDGCGNLCGECKYNEYCGEDYKCHQNIIDAGTDIPDIKDVEIIDSSNDTSIADIGNDSNISDTEEKDTIMYDTGVVDVSDTSNIQDNYSGDVNSGDTIIIKDATYDTAISDSLIPDSTSQDIKRIDNGYEENTEEDRNLETSSGCSCSITN